METNPGPTVDVVPSARARWRREGTRNDVRIVLDDGQLQLKIRRNQATDRVSIGLPDGEIEDRGTILDVSVTGGHTSALAVHQGSVVLRLRDHAPQTISAGQRWVRESADAGELAAEQNLGRRTSAMPGVDSAQAGTPVAAAGGKSADGDTRRHVLPQSPASAPASAGASARAPIDIVAERAEDEAYLHIVELARNGDAERARLAARDYLLRFPNGFRRVEVLNIVTRQGH